MSAAEVDVVTGEIVPAGAHLSPGRDTFGIVDVALRLADMICDTQMVPQALRGHPDALVAVILQGYELGLGPMQSLRSVVMIQGTPTLKAETMRAMMLARGHAYRLEATDEVATFECHRREWPAERWDTFTFTMADAKRANLVGKDNWKMYPRSMLSARVTSEAARAVFPDVVAGVSYTPEEIGDTAPASPPPTVDHTPPGATPEELAAGGRTPEGECAVEGAAELLETLMGEPEAVRFAFRDWRKAQGYPQTPQSPEMLADMQSELAKIKAEHRRDNAPYEAPIRGDSAPVGSGLD